MNNQASSRSAPIKGFFKGSDNETILHVLFYLPAYITREYRSIQVPR
jgi:hypothetical protein